MIKKLRAISCFLLVLFGRYHVCSSQEQVWKIGSWGDQGDGTYKNPILNADYPDVDVEKVGDTYYMISSKQHMSPGMVILESKDLVNWTNIGHVWDSLSWGKKYDWNQMNGYAFGVWAGDLAFHNGTWYCYFIDRNYGLFMSSSEDIRGPWTEPHRMLAPNKVFNDPAVYWDEETHEAFLVCNTGNLLNSKKDKNFDFETRLYKMSWDGRTIIDSGQVIYSGYGAEAAKIYNINDIWYIFISEWYIKEANGDGRIHTSENDRKQIVLRSKTNSIYGPFEKKVVFQRGNGIEQSCSQGALVQVQDNSWWYIHQLVQNTAIPFQGRPQLLQPVVWVDGWPIIGADVDNDGIGEPVMEYKKPILGFSVMAPYTDDDFSENKLGFQWEWNHNPRNTHWSLTERPGWLRLKASKPVPRDSFNKVEVKRPKGIAGAYPFWRACNTLSQRIMGTTYGTAIAKFDISRMAIGQRAGFVRFGGVYHMLGVYMDDWDSRYIFYVNKKGEEKIGPRINGGFLYVKTVNNGNKAYFEYSLDGNVYHRFGQEFTIEFGNWTGDRLGFFNWNEVDESGVIDVDWFYYDYDGPKGEITTKK